MLDLSRLLPGGFCSLLLADFGAEVLKVEDTGMGDYIRWSPPFHEGADDSREVGAVPRPQPRQALDPAGPEDRARAGRCCCGSCATTTCCSSRSGPGVMERLGVGYERLREENPRLVYCAITGYGQDGPYTGRSGHDMNYLGLNGLLGLTGDADGPPVQPAGQIADLGGGALMAAFGILAALRERERSGEGQLVDVSMFDGSLSWLALVAAQYLADGAVPRRGGSRSRAGSICYRPYACRDGWVTLGALEPKFWQAWCRGVGREDLVEKQFEAPGSDAHAEVERIFLERTRDEWQAFASEHDCCLEPVLGLDEALDSELVRAREMVVGARPARRRVRCRLLGVPVKLSRTPGAPAGPGPGARASTPTRCCRRSATPRTRSPRSSRRVPSGRPGPGLEGLLPGLGVALSGAPGRAGTYPDCGEGEVADEALACPVGPAPGVPFALC